MNILSVVGARPNFIKIAPLLEEMRRRKIRSPLVHTGQHSTYEMSRVFFQQLAIPKPEYNLGVKFQSEIQQLATIIKKLERVLRKEHPDFVLVVGDVTSTLAGALTAAKLRIPLIHVEAGLRSFDRRMPEETNRILIDHLSDFLFATEPQAVKNLLCEGIARQNIFHVGNVMIDALKKSRGKWNNSVIRETLQLQKRAYGVVTLHRPENIEQKKTFFELLKALYAVQKHIPLVWPMHPHANKTLAKFKLARFLKSFQNLKIIQPLPYLDMISLLSQSRIVFTDSGGIQEETTALRVPCLTLRKTTERPVTITKGTNKVVGTNKALILKETLRILKKKVVKGTIPPYWDGNTANRIVRILIKNYASS